MKQNIPLCGVPIRQVRRHFLWYVCPLTPTPQRAGISVRAWQAPWLRSALSKCSGRKICCIATPGPEADPKDFVHPKLLEEEYRDLGFEVITTENSKEQQEGPALVRMLGMVKDGHTTDDAIFFGHAKGVTRPVDAPVIKLWTEVMLEVVANPSDARLVKALTAHGCAGALKRYGEFVKPGNHAWHYSGSYYWVRATDVFRRNWEHLHDFFASVEAWPGYQFSSSQAYCFLGDHAGDPYRAQTWHNDLLPALSRYRDGQQETPYAKVWR